MLAQIDRHFVTCPRVVPGYCISCPRRQMGCPRDNGTMLRSSAAVMVPNGFPDGY